MNANGWSGLASAAMLLGVIVAVGCNQPSKEQAKGKGDAKAEKKGDGKKEISKEDLPIALRGATPEIKDKFLKNMSSRAAEMLKDDMEARGPVKVSDVEKSQQNILKVCRKLEEEGRIVIGGGGGEELL